mgnify:CR=1
MLNLFHLSRQLITYKNIFLDAVSNRVPTKRIKQLKLINADLKLFYIIKIKQKVIARYLSTK